ncbi:MAG: GspH/FimT family pseudopilin [Rhodanobacter sp.]
MNRNHSRIQGFTLIELVVTLVVLAILLAIALPSFTTAINNNHVASASNTLLADISYARTEAIDRGTDVSICPSSTGQTCTGGTAYDTGWLVYTYTAGNAVVSTAYDNTSATNVVLRYTTAQRGVSIQTESTVPIISFGPQGEMKPDTTESSFVTCSTSGTGGTAQSTATVPGVWLTILGSGSAYNQPWPVGTACTGPAPASSTG